MIFVNWYVRASTYVRASYVKSSQAAMECASVCDNKASYRRHILSYNCVGALADV